jgi:hypothetical protein
MRAVGIASPDVQEDLKCEAYWQRPCCCWSPWRRRRRTIVEGLATEVKRILEMPDVASSLKAVGAEPAPMPPDAFAAFARTERWKEVVRVSPASIEARHRHVNTSVS